jgi:hypothetical protein
MLGDIHPSLKLVGRGLEEAGEIGRGDVCLFVVSPGFSEMHRARCVMTVMCDAGPFEEEDLVSVLPEITWMVVQGLSFWLLYSPLLIYVRST